MKDPYGFIDDIEMIFIVMHISDIERDEISAYQLKVKAYQWYNEWEKIRGKDTKPLV